MQNQLNSLGYLLKSLTWVDHVLAPLRYYFQPMKISCSRSRQAIGPIYRVGKVQAEILAGI